MVPIENKSRLKAQSEVHLSKSNRGSHGKGIEGLQRAAILRSRDVRRRCIEKMDSKYSGIAYNMKKKLACHATLNVLELEAYVDLDGS